MPTDPETAQFTSNLRKRGIARAKSTSTDSTHARLQHFGMKVILQLWCICSMAVLVGCASTYGVDHNYDSVFNFDYLKSYGWGRVNIQAKQDVVTVEDIRTAVDQILQRKGYKHSAIRPDFIVASTVGTRQRAATPPDPYMAAFGYYAAPPQRYFEDITLTVSVFTPRNNDRIWSGSANIDVSGRAPEDIVKAINAATRRILKKFPPRQGTGY